MLHSVFAKSIWERRQSLVWWVLGIVALVGLTVAVYPSVADQQFDELFQGMPEELASLFGVDQLADLNTPEGYVNSQIYANMGPILLLIFSIGFGAAAVAGEEDKNTMDLLLAQPITRTRIVIEKFASMAVLTFGLAGVIYLLLLITNGPTGLDLAMDGLVAANVGVALLAIFFGTLTLMIGALTGKRALSLGVGAGVAVASFFIYGLAPLVDALTWTQNLSPFGWFLDPKPLNNGFAVAETGLLLAGIAIFLLVAVWAFERRDVAV